MKYFHLKQFKKQYMLKFNLDPPGDKWTRPTTPTLTNASRMDTDDLTCAVNLCDPIKWLDYVTYYITWQNV